MRSGASSSGTLSSEIGSTLERFAQGLAVAIVCGVALGILIGSSCTLGDASFVVIEFLRPIPAVVLIPVALLFLGLGTPTIRFVIAYAAVWPILVNTLYGVRGGDRLLHDVARTSGIGRAGRVMRVTLPAALPSITTGIRVAAPIALACGRDRRVGHVFRRNRLLHEGSNRMRSSSRRCTRRSC